jgi:F0F1-type ATP synthase assembly protein I
MSKPPIRNNPWKYATYASAIGMNLVVCIVLGYFIGTTLAKHTGWAPWSVIGVLGGLFTGLGSIVLMIMRILEDTNE